MIYKVYSVIIRHMIFLFDGVNNKLFTSMYTIFLKNRGVVFLGRPNYIASSAYFDGQGFNKITIGKDVVISKEVMLLTHDFSIETALHAVGRGSEDRHIKINKCISIGNNSFIGARASLLPGTFIGNNCIIGSCAVVKGNIPDGSIVIGNPGRIVSNINDYAKKMITIFEEI